MAANWKIERYLEKQGLSKETVHKTFQMIKTLQGKGANPGIKFQQLYDGKNGGVCYMMWQDLRRAKLVD